MFNTVEISKLLYDGENQNNKIMRDIRQKFKKVMDDDFEKTFKLEKYVDGSGFFKRDMYSMSREAFIIILSQHRGTWKVRKKMEIIKNLIKS